MNNIDLPAKRHTTYKDQQDAVLKAFEGTPKTMLQAAAISGVMRSNITWYMQEFRRLNQIERVGSGICPISKRRAGLYVRKGGE